MLKKINIKLRDIIILCALSTAIVFFLVILYLKFYESENIRQLYNYSNPDIGNILQSASNIISISAFVTGVLTVLMGLLCFITFNKYKETLDLKNDAENILKEKRKELHEFTTKQIYSHFAFFQENITNLFNNHKNIIESIKNDDQEALGNAEDYYDDLIDQFRHIQNLFRRDKDKIEKALNYIKGKKMRNLIIFIEQFIMLRKEDESFKELINKAKDISDYLSGELLVNL